MKDLILVRHAKSSWNDPALGDHERVLNQRGRRDAPDMGGRLRLRGCDPDLIVSSSAVRARETARILAGELDYSPDGIKVQDRLYGAGPAELVEVIRATDASVGILMLVGHNPGLTVLANRLGPREILNLPTCAMLHLQFDVDTWSAVGTDRGREVLYDFPKRGRKP